MNIFELAPLALLSDNIYISVFILIFCGFLVGVTASLFGVGGGFFFTPFFHAVMNLEAPLAVATSMGQMPFLSFSGTVKNLYLRKIKIKLGVLLLISSIPAAQITAYMIGNIHHTKWGSEFLFKKITYADFFVAFFYSLLLASLGVYGLLKNKKSEENQKKTAQPKSLTVPILFMGIIFGFISSVFGIGGGFLAVPFFMYYCSLSPSEAAATSLFCIFILSAITTAHYLYMKNLYFGLSLLSAAGTTPGAVIGAYLGARMPAKKMKKYFGILQILVAVSYLFLKFY
ncbi:MAG: sulfite exporter TauE/SafE family protein [Spirochaetia bacterium]|nr:sulfite exporter TauE/SafE family protein [Spirochaetia bacterium]